MNSIELGLLSAAGVVTAAVMLSVFSTRLVGVPMRWMAFVTSALIGAVISAASWLVGLTGVPAAFVAPLVALGALFSTLVSMRQRMAGAGVLRIALFSTVMSVVIFVPAAVIVWAFWYDPFATGLGYLDLGAALPVGVAASSAVLAVLLLDRRRAIRPQRSVRGWSMLWPALVMWVGWICWLIGLELAFDDLTPVILANSIFMPIAATVSVMLVERARHRSNSSAGLALGILAGVAAATPAAGYVIPGLGALIALIVGALCALLPRTPLVRIPGTMIIGSGSSLILLGVFAQDVSFIYTGQPEVLFGQVLTVFVGAVAGFVVGFGVWALVRRPASTFMVPTQ